MKIIRQARSGLSGFFGRRLPPHLRHPLRMELLHKGRCWQPEELAERIRGLGSGREVVVFVHGLMLDESCWSFSSFDMSRAFELGFDVVSLLVRYDSSRHIYENGRDLAELLESLHQHLGDWDERWHLLGHSMGGLVIRSALIQAEQARMGFLAAVEKVFFLGTPHRGAPLEKSVQMTQSVLRAALALPIWGKVSAINRAAPRTAAGQTRALELIGRMTDTVGRRLPRLSFEALDWLMDLRSDGIRDLREGRLLSAPLADCGANLSEPTRLTSSPISKSSPLLASERPGARFRYYSLAGTLTNRPCLKPTVLRSDGMVTTASAANLGPEDDLRLLEKGRFFILTGVSHFTLTFEPRVFEVLAKWFAEQ